MSLILAGKTASGIVVASDRRLTGEKNEGETTFKFVTSDNEQKTFLVNHRFSISYCGNANIKGLPTSAHIQRSIELMKNCYTTFSVAEALNQYWHEKSINNRPSIIISGYNSDGPSIIEIKPDCDAPVIHHKNNDIYGFVYHGETDIVKSLLNSGEIQYSLMSPQDMVELFELLIVTTAKLQKIQRRQQTVSEKYDLLLLSPTAAKWIISPSSNIF